MLAVSRLAPRLTQCTAALKLTPKTPYYPKRTLMTLQNHKYTAQASATGLGRNGQTSSGSLTLHLSSPTEFGGKGDGSNPEQLFAMGYASCFLGAVQLMASRMGKASAARDAVVNVNVHLGEPKDREGLGLAVDIVVEGADDEVVQAAHAVCPYSRALQHGAVVNVSTK